MYYNSNSERSDGIPLQQAVQAVLKKRRVEGLLEVTYHRKVDRRWVRRYRDQPARLEERVRYEVQVQRHAEAIRAARRRMGWRLYVVNAPAEGLPWADAVRAYREAPVIERDFRRGSNLVSTLGLGGGYISANTPGGAVRNTVLRQPMRNVTLILPQSMALTACW